MGTEVVAAALGGEEAPDLVVGREHGGGGPELGAHVGDHVAVHGRERLHPGAVVLDDPVDAALHPVPPEHLEDDVLGADPVGQGTGQANAPDLGHGHVERLAGHGQRHVETPGADGEHAERTAGAGVAVGAEQRLARHAESLHVNRVADAVAGLGVPQAELPGRAAQELVVVGVAAVGLEQVVVDVLGRQLGADPIQTHGLELEHHHGAGGVLGQGLVDPQSDLGPRLHHPLDEVGIDQLVGNRVWHRFLCTRSRPDLATSGRSRSVVGLGHPHRQPRGDPWHLSP